MMNRRLSSWLWFLDYMVIPALVIFVAYQPNFIHGFVDYLEAGQFLSVINEVFHGKVPVKDIFILYGPLHIYLPAFAMLLFGKTLGVLRAYFHFGSIFSLIIAYLLGRSICRSRFFSYLIALLLLLEVNHPFWSTRWGGIRMGLGLLILLFLITFVKRRGRFWLFWAGVLSGFALLYSTEIGILSFMVSLITVIFVSSSERDRHFLTAVRILLPYLGGALLIVLPFLLYLFLKNALRSYFITSFIILPLNHIKVWRVPIPQIFPPYLNIFNFVSWLLTSHFKIFLPAIIYAIAITYILFKFFKKVRTESLIILSILTIYGLSLYLFSLRAIWGPQLQTALPVVLILECLFLENCFLYCKKEFSSLIHQYTKKKISIVLSLICILSVSFIFLLCSEKRYYNSLRGWFFCQMNKDKLMPMHNYPIPISKITLVALEIEGAKGILVPKEQKEEIDGVTNYIIKNTEPGEPVFTFLEHGIYNFFADRPVVGRFPIAGLALTTKEYRAELLEGIKEEKPRYIIFGNRPTDMAISIRKRDLLPEIANFIKENYIVEKRFGAIDIYRRK